MSKNKRAPRKYGFTEAELALIAWRKRNETTVAWTQPMEDPAEDSSSESSDGQYYAAPRTDEFGRSVSLRSNGKGNFAGGTCLEHTNTSRFSKQTIKCKSSRIARSRNRERSRSEPEKIGNNPTTSKSRHSRSRSSSRSRRRSSSKKSRKRLTRSRSKTRSNSKRKCSDKSARSETSPRSKDSRNMNRKRARDSKRKRSRSTERTKFNGKWTRDKYDPMEQAKASENKVDPSYSPPAELWKSLAGGKFVPLVRKPG